MKLTNAKGLSSTLGVNWGIGTVATMLHIFAIVRISRRGIFYGKIKTRPHWLTISDCTQFARKYHAYPVTISASVTVVTCFLFNWCVCWFLFILSSAVLDLLIVSFTSVLTRCAGSILYYKWLLVSPNRGFFRTSSWLLLWLSVAVGNVHDIQQETQRVLLDLLLRELCVCTCHSYCLVIHSFRSNWTLSINSNIHFTTFCEFEFFSLCMELPLWLWSPTCTYWTLESLYPLVWLWCLLEAFWRAIFFMIQSGF